MRKSIKFYGDQGSIEFAEESDQRISVNGDNYDEQSDQLYISFNEEEFFKLIKDLDKFFDYLKLKAVPD